jgi:hypothetical protein
LQIHWMTPWILFFINPSINDLDTVSLQVHGMTKSASFELTFWSVADTRPRARLFTGLDSENQGRTSIHLGSLWTSRCVWKGVYPKEVFFFHEADENSKKCVQHSFRQTHMNSTCCTYPTPFEVNWHLYIHTLSCCGKECNLQRVGKILVVDIFREAELQNRIWSNTSIIIDRTKEPLVLRSGKRTGTVENLCGSCLNLEPLKQSQLIPTHLFPIYSANDGRIPIIAAVFQCKRASGLQSPNSSFSN